MTISADNFWIELDRLLGAPATTAAQMEALMERYGRVWPDIHHRAIQSLDQFRSLTRALVISGMTPQEAQAENRFARGVTRLYWPETIFPPYPC